MAKRCDLSDRQWWKIADPDNNYPTLDSSLARAHQQAAIGKGEVGTRLWGVREAD